MDPNQWRNQAYNSLVQGFPTFDPYISTEQTVGDLSPHAHLPGTRPVPGLSGSSTVFTGPFKPTALTPLEGVRQREPDNFGLDLSPPKPLFAQDRNHSWRQPNLAQTSHSLIGNLPTDLSSLGQRFLPPPAHRGISSLHQSTIQEGPTQNNLINSPLSPTFNSQFSERSDTFERNSQHLQQEQSDILNSRREQLLRSSAGNFTYPLPTSQPYLDSVKHEQFEQVRTTVSLSDHRGDNYNQYFSTGSSFRNPEHLSFHGSNSLHQQSFGTDQRIVSTDPQQNTYNSQRILVSEENSNSFTSNRGPVTIQAVADSTTKPKKGRGRKKKETIIEETKSANEKKLVDSFIQQEQQLKVFSQKGGEDNLYKQSQLLMSGNIYGQNYASNNQSLSHFSMQSSQISSSKLPDMSQGQLISHSQNMMGAGYSQSTSKHSTQVHGGYDFAASGTMMENLGQRNINNDTYRNSTIQNENFNPQGIASSRNNFMSSNNQHGFSEGNTPMQNPHGQNRIIDNNQFSYEGAPNQSSFVAQLNSSEFDALEMDQGVYSGNGNLCNLDTFNSYGQNMTQQNYCANPQSNPSSTVDEAALSSLISDNPHVEQQNLRGRLFEGFSDDFSQNKPFIAEPALPPSAVLNPVEEDDEFQHLKKPPVTEKTTNEQVPKVQPQGQVKVDPPQPQKPVEKQPPAKSNKNNAFMDSFLSFIQGKKPETLSSVNTAVTKKPQLPKYIPEPKRPRQTSVEKSSDSAASTPKPDSDNKSDSNSLSNGDTSSMSSSKTKMSDDDEASTGLTGTVKNIDTGDKEHPSIKMRIKLQKTPPKQKRSKTSGKSIVKQKRSRSNRGSDEDHERSSGEEYQVGSSQEEERERTPSPVIPARRTSARKAKEIAQQKKYKDSESDMEEDKVPETYDSDSDPAWTPVADEKKEPAFDGDLGSSQRRGRSRNTKTKPKLKRPSKAAKPIPAKSPRVERVSYPRVPSPEIQSSSEDTDEENSTASQALVMGAFVINKKDLNNFEGFPIWKIEAGKMMRKYELYVEKGEILHRSLSTYSSWLPNMEKNYVSVRTKQIPHTRATIKDSQYIVQVLEEDRPKPKLDSSKETEYEKDPLADMFNVFMQVFLSQAMEPTFLEAIHESGDDFYLKPLKKIDDIISKKLIEINSKVRWMMDFKKTAEKRPHIREVDRPNLKTLCQATENATQNAIKSVHLFGQPYDRTTLKEIPDNTAQQGSVEYLLGKSASHYIGAYHSLHHFKYNLYKRCLAKVDIVREGNTKLDNAEILDKCLNNRTWVLKIFDDLKNMLEKG